MYYCLIVYQLRSYIWFQIIVMPVLYFLFMIVYSLIEFILTRYHYFAVRIDVMNNIIILLLVWYKACQWKAVCLSSGLICMDRRSEVCYKCLLYCLKCLDMAKCVEFQHTVHTLSYLNSGGTCITPLPTPSYLNSWGTCLYQIYPRVHRSEYAPTLLLHDYTADLAVMRTTFLANLSYFPYSCPT